MMIKAKITIFDDETGQVFEKDRVIEPYRDEEFLDEVLGGQVTSHVFRFEIRTIKPTHMCINCKHFSCNKPTPYCDNQVIVKDRCTLHIGEDDARGYCDDYERGI